MIYSSPSFIVFLIIQAFLFSALRGSYKMRLAQLVLSSFFFYAWAGVFDFLLFLFVLVFSWICIFLSEKFPAKKRAFVISGITILTIHLFVWKYAAWAIGGIQSIAPGFLNGRKFSPPLPIGISFFTLQGIAYLVDYMRGSLRPLSFPEFALYKSYFPQLIAGPIVRGKQLIPQIQKLSPATAEDVMEGLELFVTGFFKKVVIADRVAPFVDRIFEAPHSYSRSTLIAAVLGYSVQIWGDFNGYTDMGRGASRFFGIKLPKNFYCPYLSRSPSEFWRRWHVTLSEWIRDYIYIPLGGSKGSLGRAILVAMVTMTISGLWHGAAVTFAVWGLYHGALLAIERAMKSKSEGAPQSPARTILAIAATYIAVVVGWLFFRAGTFAGLRAFLSAFADGNGATHPLYLSNVFMTFAFMAFFHFYEYGEDGPPTVAWLGAFTARLRGSVKLESPLVRAGGLALLFAASVYMRFSEIDNPFIYFQF